MKKIVKISILFFIVFALAFSNYSYASWADFDDETADKQTKQLLEEQKKEDAKNAGKSSDNYLSSLSVEGFSISPAFEKQTINYEIKDELKVDKVKINATANNSKATITGTGEKELKPGENILEINVTAENGIMRTYYIKVKKYSNEKNSSSTNTTNTTSNTTITSKDTKANEDSNNEKAVMIALIVVIIFILFLLFRKKSKK